MAIFFSLSQPDGLEKKYRLGTGCGSIGRVPPHNPFPPTLVTLHENGVSFHHLRWAVERKAVESVHQIFVQDVQVFHLLHRSVNERGSIWLGCQGHFLNNGGENHSGASASRPQLLRTIKANAGYTAGRSV